MLENMAAVKISAKVNTRAAGICRLLVEIMCKNSQKYYYYYYYHHHHFLSQVFFLPWYFCS
jgi:hypothetical protein